MRPLVILDFDGTMTDAEAEGLPFTAGYLEDVAALTGRDVAEINEMARRFEAEVLVEPQKYGWLYKGRIVCPATVDPYQRFMPVMKKILDACGAFEVEAERERLEQVLFRYNYKKTVRAFRPHAVEALRALQDFDTWVVTNAHVDPVRAKISELDAQAGGALRWLLDRVVGLAKKQVVEDSETDLPAELKLPGLSRPVLVRRPHFRAVLEKLREGRPWDQVVAVGDIFELDLSLPLTLGARVVLTANAFTPPWEKSFVAAHPRGRVIEDLRELAGIVRG
ncbi:MAG TPA: HAD family hydrolase [Myxococcales bacterium]|jgi:phosphoglycolate phosphatase-like HAD superfamily hydrolase